MLADEWMCGGRRVEDGLADQGGLLQGDEHGAHAGHVLGLLTGLGVEVAEPGHPLPLGAGVVLVQV